MLKEIKMEANDQPKILKTKEGPVEDYNKA